MDVTSEAPAPEATDAPTYTSEAGGIRDAAREVSDRRREEHGAEPEPHKVEVNDADVPEDGMTLREAAGGLSDYRRQLAEDRAALERALGISKEPQDGAPAAEPQATPAADDAARQRLQEAERAKQAAATERAQAEQARRLYAQSLQAHLQAVRSEILTEFPEIKSEADLMALAGKDPPKFARALAALQKGDAIASGLAQVAQAQEHERRAQFQTWASQQDASFNDRHPELRDETAKRHARDLVLRHATAEGLTVDELARLWSGEGALSLRDARVQSMMLDAARYREAMAAARNATKANLPPVQRPGVAQPHGSRHAGELDTLQGAFKSNPTARAGAALLAARRAARRG